MRAGDLAPNDADLGTADLLLSLVDERNLLAEVEAVSLSALVIPPRLRAWDLLGGVGVINTLDLDQAGLGAGGVAGTLVGKVATPVIVFVSLEIRPCSRLLGPLAFASLSSWDMTQFAVSFLALPVCLLLPFVAFVAGVSVSVPHSHLHRT